MTFHCCFNLYFLLINIYEHIYIILHFFISMANLLSLNEESLYPNNRDCNVLSFPCSSGVKNPPANAGDVGSIPGSGRFPGEGNGNPLQYSCLENSMDRGAWWTTVHAVAKSQTWLSTHTVTQWYSCQQSFLESLMNMESEVMALNNGKNQNHLRSFFYFFGHAT